MAARALRRAAEAAARMARSALSAPIRALEAPALRRHGDRPLAHQPVFIIGAPRTGSTILYQALTNTRKVSYIDNLACRWYRNLYFGLWLSRRRFGETPHGNFEAERGSTIGHGDHAPSECGSYWYRWLDRDRHFVDDADITEAMVDGIRREITAVINRYDMPILIKNLNAGQRLRLLARCFPEARLVWIRRDAAANRRSILGARRQAGVGADGWWSVRPRDVQQLMALPEGERVAAQIASLERQIEEDLALFPPANVMCVHHDELSPELVDRLGAWMGAGKRAGGMPTFRRDADVARAATP